MRNHLRADGTILVNNVPFFPFGAYSIPRTETEADKTQCFNDMIAAGFNIATLEDDGTTASRTTINNLLTLAGNGNLKVLIGASHSPSIIYPPQKYDTYPATLGYIISDDGDNGIYTVPELTQRNADVKSFDNTRITFLTLTGWSATERSQADSYTNISDVSGYQCYPLGSATGSDWNSADALTDTYSRTLAYVKSAALNNKPMLMHLQTFNWGIQSSSPRYPTVSELRNMLYTGLAAGIKGVLSYDFSFDLKNNQPALWSEFKTLRTDVSALENALLNGTLTRVDTGDSRVVSSYWTYNNMCYIVVVNTSYTASKTVSIPLPSPYTGSKTALFSRMPNTLSVTGTALAGNLSPQDVQVFRIDAATTTYPIITARGDNQPNEGKEKAFDGNNFSKWLDVSATTWLQIQYQNPVIYNQYVMVSGNDYPVRDPKDWTLQGSNNGTSWTTLDSQTGQSWNGRNQANTYLFSNTMA